MNTKDFLKNNSYIIIFLLFYFYLIKQFENVFIYYDDFGYLSLSYGYVTPNVIGDNYNFFQLLDFMYNHYFYANGRLLYTSLFPLTNLIGGISTVQIFMATVILSAFFLMFREISKRNSITGWKKTLLAIFVCLLYGLISITTHRQGTYWYAASFLYVTPIIIFIIFSSLYYKTLNRDIKLKSKVLLVTLAFLAGFSTEQWLVAAIIFILTIIGWKIYIKVKIKLYDVLVFIFALIGALPILTSPAAKLRMNNHIWFTELSFLEKFLLNTKVIINSFFSWEQKFYLVFLLGTFIIVSLYLIEKRKGLLTINIIHLLYSIILLSNVLFGKMNEFLVNNEIFIYLTLCYFVVTLFQLFVLYKNKNIYPFMIFFAAFASIGCMILVPEIPVRAYIPFYLLSFLLMGDIFYKIINKNFNYTFLVLVFLMIISTTNMKIIYDGYDLNDNILESNHEVLILSSEKGFMEADLEKLSDILYGSDMLYYDGFDIMREWMNEYYDLPEGFNYNFNE